MNKLRLLGIFDTKLNHITLCYASLVLWAYPDTPDYFEQIHAATVGDKNYFPNVSNLVNNAQRLKIATDELYSSAHRSAIKDLFPLLKKYCHDTGQMELLKDQAWFDFWWVLRNCWSHDMTFNFNPAEKKRLPIRWLDVSVTEEMNGRPLTHGQCSYEHLRLLVETARSVRTELWPNRSLKYVPALMGLHRTRLSALLSSNVI
ncbi:MAG: hypothetical protein U5L08_01585 [Xanthomonadales bacterium]|nr:hypothetical protein [Xanthomonadales bacterium]